MFRVNFLMVQGTLTRKPQNNKQHQKLIHGNTVKLKGKNFQIFVKNYLSTFTNNLRECAKQCIGEFLDKEEKGDVRIDKIKIVNFSSSASIVTNRQNVYEELIKPISGFLDIKSVRVADEEPSIFTPVKDYQILKDSRLFIAFRVDFNGGTFKVQFNKKELNKKSIASCSLISKYYSTEVYLLVQFLIERSQSHGRGKQALLL